MTQMATDEGQGLKSALGWACSPVTRSGQLPRFSVLLSAFIGVICG
jgi:hypothetical protein